MRIAPSLLSADFGKLNAEIADIEAAGADMLHLDVMDGHFVPNLTFGAPVIAKLRTTLPKDTHLMIADPERYFDDFIQAGSAAITFHIEAVSDPVRASTYLRERGVQAGISLRPLTPLSDIAPYLSMLDMVLVMTVEPGFGGQSFMEEQLEKVRAIKMMHPHLTVSVDGGITPETIGRAAAAGADIAVAGTAVFGQADRGLAVAALKRAALSHDA